MIELELGATERVNYDVLVVTMNLCYNIWEWKEKALHPDGFCEVRFFALEPESRILSPCSGHVKETKRL